MNFVGIISGATKNIKFSLKSKYTNLDKKKLKTS